MHERFLLALLSSVLLVGPASAGPITVFTEVWSAGGNNTGEIPVGGLGNWATLTWGSSPGPTVTVPAGQTTASQAVVGFWPVMEFSNLAQYQAQRPTVVTVPVTPVQLYVEVWDGAYGLSSSPVKQLFVDATVSAQVSPTAGQNTVDWQFAALPAKVMFGDGTVVSLNYQAVVMPAGVPSIQFQDGTPPIGFPGPTYYPTLVDADVTVSRPIETPEPSSACYWPGWRWAVWSPGASAASDPNKLPTRVPIRPLTRMPRKTPSARYGKMNRPQTYSFCSCIAFATLDASCLRISRTVDPSGQ